MEKFKTLIAKAATGTALSRQEAASAFDQIMSGSAGRFCSQISLPVRDSSLITSARLIDRDSGGAEYYVTKAPDGRGMLGLIKRRGG